ncbi:unnamed protein product [Paramecium sonneborni]|uniref:non-specific serine/threonine protein kinase n=1 Tax=Paramecium sonneborni TaxID=65129 RepID=A0A8S1P4L8_9CILI|nr:unnamed protein product [Paramecium sonneborni]
MSKSFGKYFYEEKNLLGSGAFGKVYRGFDTENKIEVAIKVSSTKNVRKEVLAILENEIQMMKRLEHPNLIQLYDVFEQNDEKIVVMELCKRDLKDLITKKNVQENEILNIVLQLLNGLKELARLGLLHRDLKPANCFECGGIFKLGDFGSVIEADYSGKKLMKQQFGTLAYEAPQMLMKEKYSVKCDIWSLGILIYESLFGQYPWQCQTEGQYLRAMKTWGVRFPIGKRISNECQDFILRCLAIQEKNRMDWDELFEHRWLNIQENERKFTNSLNYEQIEHQLLDHLNQIAAQQHFHPKEMFQIYDLENKGLLDFKQFERFIMQFDPRLIKKEIIALFSYLDQDHKNKIDLSQFEKIFRQ